MYTKHKWNSEHYYNFSYLRYLPKDFDPSKQYPLVFFLHGAGERGNNLDEAMRHGYMKYVREEGKEYPFIFVAPQCPKKKDWSCFTESLMAFLDHICETLPVDRDRVYLTGLSMGGTGSWILATADPSRFAALIPICGKSVFWNASSFTNLPIIAYHGDDDPIIPVCESASMVSAINRGGGCAQIRILNGVGHNAWEYAYKDDELMKWMLQQSRKHCENM